MLFNRFFSKKHQLALFSIVSLTLMSCSSSPKKTQPSVNQTPVEVEKSTTVENNARSIIEQAELSLASAPDQASHLLIQAAQAYIQEGKPNNALWLAKQLAKTPELQTNQQQYQVVVITAQAYQQLAPEKDLSELLFQADELAEQSKIAHTIEYYQLKAFQAKQSNQLVSELDALLRVFSLDSDITNGDIEYLWVKFSELTQWQQQQLNQLSAPLVTPWLTLTSIANNYGHEASEFSRHLTQWQTRNGTHPASVIAQQLLQEQSIAENNLNEGSPAEPEVIAVILPLSGKQVKAGQVAQEGILAAYQNNQALTLKFIDANQLDFTTLADDLSQMKATRVIGPLLKQNVEQFLAQSIQLPTLLLNIPNQTQLQEYQIAISMRPEDEAIQAAAQLSDKRYNKPLILSHNDGVSQRIAQTFASQWQSITGETIESMTYSQGKDMQTQLKASLGVDASQKRIADLRLRLDQIIKIEERNRRDIDMIYIVGNNSQTRLIKPYIDVNIATFANIIPVYASSRSHSLIHDDSALVDLNGMTFTEMPWMLSSEQQNTPLAKQAKSLWPNRSDSLQRIFAMGYDAISLVNKINAFQTKPYVRHFGQTGVLKLNDQNVLTRSLLWGQYNRNNVKQLAQIN